MNQSSFDAYNTFLIDGDLDRFTKILSRYEYFKMIVDLPGDIVECGVFKGQGLLFWAKVIQIFNPLSPRKVIGFDTFSGVPKTVRSAKERQRAISLRDYETVPKLIKEKAEELHLDHRIEIVAGDALETIPKFVEENPGFRIALLNLDFDVYEPTRAALEGFYDRIVGGGVITIDEYAIHDWSESNAVDEFIKGKNIELKSIPWALSPTAYFKKPHS